MKKLVFVIITLLISTVAHSYEGTPEEQVKSFLKSTISGDPNVAIDSLFASNPVVAQKVQQLALLKQQVNTVNTLYGRPFAHENVVVEKISPSVTRIVEIVKHELQPIVWEFYFYKPKNKWIISQALFADQFQFLDKKQ